MFRFAGDHATPIFLGVDSSSILFNHRYFEKPAVSPGILMVLWKEGSLERMEMEVTPRIPPAALEIQPPVGPSLGTLGKVTARTHVARRSTARPVPSARPQEARLQRAVAATVESLARLAAELHGQRHSAHAREPRFRCLGPRGDEGKGFEGLRLFFFLSFFLVGGSGGAEGRRGR